MSSLELEYVEYDDGDFQRLLLREREEEITQISSDIIKVRDIFSDLGTLVTDQQQHVDDIENQISNAVTNTDGGVKQLTKAANNQRTRSTCCLYVFVIGTVILVIIIVAIIVFNNIS